VRKAQAVATENFLGSILTKATFAEKMEAIRSVNPYFYLLTPLPRSNNEANQ
jgi:hypothetical protein